MTGAEVKQLRETLGRSQRQMARLCGVTPNTILNWENEKTPVQGAALRLLEVLGIFATLASLLGLSGRKGR